MTSPGRTTRAARREWEVAAPETLDTLLTSDQRELIERALARLPDDQRIALALYPF